MIKSGSFLTLLKLLAAFAAFILKLYLIERLTTQDFGQYSYFISFTQILSIFLLFGYNVSLVLTSGQMSYSRNLETVIKFHALIFLFAIITLPNFFRILDVFLYSMAVILSMYLSIGNTYLNYTKKYFTLGIVDVLKSAIPLVGLLIISIFINQLSGREAVYLWILGMFIGLVISFRKINFRGLFAKRFAYLRLINLTKEGVKAMSLNFAGILMYSSDILLIEWILNSFSTGDYAKLVVISRLSWIPNEAFNTIVFGKLLNKDSVSMSKAVVLNIFISAFVAFGLVAIGDIVHNYDLLLDIDFKGSTLMILLVAGIPVNLYKLFTRYYATERKWFHLNRAAYVALLLNVLINLFFLKKYGIAVAAISSLVSYSIAAFLLIIQYMRCAYR